MRSQVIARTTFEGIGKHPYRRVLCCVQHTGRSGCVGSLRLVGLVSWQNLGLERWAVKEGWNQEQEVDVKSQSNGTPNVRGDRKYVRISGS